MESSAPEACELASVSQMSEPSAADRTCARARGSTQNGASARADASAPSAPHLDSAAAERCDGLALADFSKQQYRLCRVLRSVRGCRSARTAVRGLFPQQRAVLVACVCRTRRRIRARRRGGGCARRNPGRKSTGERCCAAHACRMYTHRRAPGTQQLAAAGQRDHLAGGERGVIDGVVLLQHLPPGYSAVRQGASERTLRNACGQSSCGARAGKTRHTVRAVAAGEWATRAPTSPVRKVRHATTPCAVATYWRCPASEACVTRPMCVCCQFTPSCALDSAAFAHSSATRADAHRRRGGVRTESVMSLKAANQPAKTGSHTRAPRSAATKRCRRADLELLLRRVRRRAPRELFLAFPPSNFLASPPASFSSKRSKALQTRKRQPAQQPADVCACLLCDCAVALSPALTPARLYRRSIVRNVSLW
jgi:hypothetical protein